MALVAGRRGRPRYVADYAYKDLAKPLYFEFYDTCDTLSYTESLALSRMLRVSLRTVYRWKTHEDFPRHLEMALATIDWSKQGRPIKQETQAEIAHNRCML